MRLLFMVRNSGTSLPWLFKTELNGENQSPPESSENRLDSGTEFQIFNSFILPALSLERGWSVTAVA